MGPMGFPREWKYDQPWDGNRMRMEIGCTGMEIKTLVCGRKSLHTYQQALATVLVLALLYRHLMFCCQFI